MGKDQVGGCGSGGVGEGSSSVPQKIAMHEIRKKDYKEQKKTNIHEKTQNKKGRLSKERKSPAQAERNTFLETKKEKKSVAPKKEKDAGGGGIFQGGKSERVLTVN